MKQNTCLLIQDQVAAIWVVEGERSSSCSCESDAYLCCESICPVSGVFFWKLCPHDRVSVVKALQPQLQLQLGCIPSTDTKPVEAFLPFYASDVKQENKQPEVHGSFGNTWCQFGGLNFSYPQSIQLGWQKLCGIDIGVNSSTSGTTSWLPSVLSISKMIWAVAQDTKSQVLNGHKKEQ